MVGRKRKNQTTAHETLERKAVRFSKRRKGLFNKAAELCMLSGCQVAIVVSSPVSEDTLYSFGHPSADVVFDAYLNNRVPDAVNNAAAMGSAIALYNENKEMEYELEKAKNKGEKRSDETDHGCWWDSEDLGKNESISELQVIVENLEKLRENAFVRMNNLLSSVLSAPGSSAASASNVDYDCKQFNFGNNVYNGNNNNNNEIGISSVSNYASIDENYVTGVNNDLEANLRAGRQEVTCLENNVEQNYFRNLLITDFEIANNEAPWCIFNNDAMHPAHQNSADCVADQNHHAYSADQSKPIATANEFEQLFNWDKS